MCPTTLLQMLAQPRRMSSIKFHSSTAKHVTLFIRHHARMKIIHRFSVSCWHFRCIVLKPRRQHVSTHGYTIMEQPVARDLFQSEAAGIMLVEPQQSSNNSLCSQTQLNRELPATNAKKDRFWLQTRSQKLIPKMKPFLASPNETIEAVSQKLKLKMASVKRDTNCPKRKEMLRRPKKNSQWMCPTTLLQMLAQPRRMSSIKFHSSTAKHVTLFIRHHARIEDHTPFFCIMLTLRRYTHKSPGSQYFPKLELDSTSPPLPPRPMLIQT